MKIVRLKDKYAKIRNRKNDEWSRIIIEEIEKRTAYAQMNHPCFIPQEICGGCSGGCETCWPSTPDPFNPSC